MVQNVAITLSLKPIVTTQPPDPAQAPLQPPKFQPLAGLSVSITLVPAAKLALQVPGQLIPAGELVTLPGPFSETDRVFIFEQVPLATLTQTGCEAMPLAIATSELVPVSIPDGTMKLTVEALFGAIEPLLQPEVFA